ncbi:hypothetical protein H8F21_13755 [Pseudomonas sp. P66]|uniref:GST C-terminal domain-containing protein n=1 Tax=Pseudomonas arcuscaelestis TaxID=2710591 RepID=A0ABS2BYW8_9PSED|nr:hypothetical protein [Pseudomonas arcuscaelestis]MBM5458630.1 hypothetical protein [Pseudomonas arcuscaelestis]
MSISTNTKLFTSPNCVKSHIVRFAAEVKGLEYIELDMVEHAQLALSQDVTESPSLSDRNVTTGELDIIIEYIDEQHPQPPLLPANTASRAVYRKQVRSFHKQLFPLLSAAKAGDMDAQANLRDYLQQMDSMVQGYAYFASSKISIMDVTIGPWLWAAKEAGLCLKPFRALSSYADRLFVLPAFQASLGKQVEDVAA